eukprot:TRINITY_DN8843_c0_g1_i5.p1 TRINITY_DN8843_c0_g1~~TRINITY_DN8843_c0_g1_i5.p1  ORF type:complete len:132 (-),score=7.12 TRINITY_DN8843_c0_g1_i5:135-530(-)
MVNGYLICSAEAESAAHLLLTCRVSQSLWISVPGQFKCSWVLPQLFEAWRLAVVLARVKTYFGYHLRTVERKKLTLYCGVFNLHPPWKGCLLVSQNHDISPYVVWYTTKWCIVRNKDGSSQWPSHYHVRQL